MEIKTDVRRFIPEQRQGLVEIGFSFFTEVQAVSIAMMLENPETRHLLGLNPLLSPLLRDVTPVAREIAINPKQPFLPNAENLPFRHQDDVITHWLQQLRERGVKEGTLEGVDFGMDHLSVYAQIDAAYQLTNGNPLIHAALVRSIDITSKPPTYSYEPNYASIGRLFPLGTQLQIGYWGSGWLAGPRMKVLLVATPAGAR